MLCFVLIKLDQYKTEHESVLSKYEDAQKKFYEVGSEIARFEQNLQNIRTTKDNTTRELERVKAAAFTLSSSLVVLSLVVLIF